MIKKHPFHLVDPSPWPFMASLAALLLGLGLVFLMHHIDHWVFLLGAMILVATLAGWWKDMTAESDTPGVYTTEVRRGLRLGMVLFIISEICFFASFFAAYFYFAWIVRGDLGDPSILPLEASLWPPKNINPLDPLHWPLLNTLLLLLSGTTVTWAHHALKQNNLLAVLQGLGLTIFLGVLFVIVQAYEYTTASFSLKGGIYPSLFYIITGFHGVHVVIGILFLTVCLFKVWRRKLTPERHIIFEAATWYWHFVDTVWILLFASIYIPSAIR